MKVIIEIEPYDECADATNSTGLTEEAYLELSDALADVGEVVDIRVEVTQS